MDCRTSREYINLTSDGRSSPGKAESLEAHIETCSQCNEFRSALAQVDNLFTAAPAASAPPMLVANIMQELDLRTEARRPRQRGLMLALATGTFVAALLVPLSAAIGFTFLLGNEPTLARAFATRAHNCRTPFRLRWRIVDCTGSCPCMGSRPSASRTNINIYRSNGCSLDLSYTKPRRRFRRTK